MKIIFPWIFCSIILLSSQNTFGQQTASNHIFEANNDSLISLLDEIEKASNVAFFFQRKEVEKFLVTGKVEVHNLSFSLEHLFQKTTLKFLLIDSINVVIFPATSNLNELTSDQYLKMIAKGSVKDGLNDQSIPNAHVHFIEVDKTLSTDENGEFTIELKRNQNYHIKISAIGYKAKELIVKPTNLESLSFQLFEQMVELDEVLFYAESQQKLSNAKIGIEKIQIDDIKTIPRLMGEVDVIKSLAYLPGVSAAGEGTRGFTVRGGSIDQNLTLLDGMPLWNTSHLLGLFSVYNGETVSSFDLYKGFVPARLGGRLSSALSVEQKKDFFKEKKGKIDVGMLSSGITYEAPLGKKKKHGIIASSRIAYPNIYIKNSNIPRAKEKSASFYDATLGFNLKLSDKDRVHLTGMTSGDDFAFDRETSNQWQNYLFSGLWKHIHSEKVFSEVRIGYSANTTTSKAVRIVYPEGYQLQSNIGYGKLSYQNKWLPNENWKLYSGASIGHYSLFYKDKVDSLPQIAPLFRDEKGLEIDLFHDFEWTVSARLDLSGGVRMVNFTAIGAQDYVEYENPSSPNVLEIIDTLTNLGGSNQFWNFEPRLSLLYKLAAKTALKAGGSRTTQNIFLISNAISPTPSDQWKLAGKYFRPKKLNQFSIGIVQGLMKNKIEISVQGFYKDYQNDFGWKDGAKIFGNRNLETETFDAKTYSYGAEFNLEKKKGKFTGRVAYTYLVSRMKSIGKDEELILNGREFPSDTDRPHDLSAYVNVKIRKRYSVTANFIYTSGRPLTFPIGYYDYDGQKIIEYSDRNAFRIPAYHRLDVSLNLSPSHKKEQRVRKTWSFSVYNVYGRNNANSVFFDHIYGQAPSLYKLTILKAPIPSAKLLLEF